MLKQLLFGNIRIDPNKIGDCVYVLYHKRWGRTLVSGQLKSKVWWENQLQKLINEPCDPITCQLNGGCYDESGNPIEPPIPYEIEMGI